MKSGRKTIHFISLSRFAFLPTRQLSHFICYFHIQSHVMLPARHFSSQNGAHPREYGDVSERIWK